MTADGVLALVRSARYRSRFPADDGIRSARWRRMSAPSSRATRLTTVIWPAIIRH